jgi:hypothetical protein
MKPLTVFFTEDNLQNSLFESIDFLARNNISRVNSPERAEIIAGRRVRAFADERLPNDRIHIMWTHEPFFSTSPTPMVRRYDKTIHIFNVYNINVYTDNFYIGPRGGFIPTMKAGDLNVPFAKRTAVTLMTNRTSSAVIDGVERSLTEVRAKIALDGHSRGIIDIFGRGWPDGVAMGESRFQDRTASKAKVLSHYNFNLCMENCNWPYYVTEKIWEAIRGRCLPLYYVNDTMEYHAEMEAVINTKDITDSEQVAEVIENMSEIEFLDRMNTLIGLYNRGIRLGYNRRSRIRTENLLGRFVASYR